LRWPLSCLIDGGLSNSQPHAATGLIPIEIFRCMTAYFAGRVEIAVRVFIWIVEPLMKKEKPLDSVRVDKDQNMFHLNNLDFEFASITGYSVRIVCVNPLPVTQTGIDHGY
jgi:hypothetical protein